MSKIKKIREYLLQKKWLHDLVVKLKIKSEEWIKSVDDYYINRYLEERVAEVKGKLAQAIAEILARNVVASRKHNLQGSTSIPAKLHIDLAVRSAEHIASSIAPLVGVQPMKSPVYSLYSLQYKEQKDDSEEAPSLATESADLSAVSEKPKRLSLEILSHPIEAMTKKLGARYTIEAAQDLSAIHGLNIETELARAISNEIVLELLFEILGDITRYAGVTDLREKKLLEGIADLEKVRKNMRTLGIHLVQEANRIAQRTRRGAGNVIYVPPAILVSLQAGGTLKPPTEEERTAQGPALVKYAGCLDSGIKVYCSQFQDADTIIMGYKGANEVDAGYFFAPYQIALSAGVVVDPVSFEPVLPMLTRFGKFALKKGVGSLVDGIDYYKVIKV